MLLPFTFPVPKYDPFQRAIPRLPSPHSPPGSNHMSWTSLRELIEELASLVPDPSSPTTGNGNGTAAADPSLDGDEVDLFPALACHLRSLSDTAAETVRQLQDVRSAVAEAYGAAQAACSAAPHADVHAAPLSAAVTEGQSAAAVATACGQEQEFRCERKRESLFLKQRLRFVVCIRRTNQ